MIKFENKIFIWHVILTGGLVGVTRWMLFGGRGGGRRWRAGMTGEEACVGQKVLSRRVSHAIWVYMQRTSSTFHGRLKSRRYLAAKSGGRIMMVDNEAGAVKVAVVAHLAVAGYRRMVAHGRTAVAATGAAAVHEIQTDIVQGIQKGIHGFRWIKLFILIASPTHPTLITQPSDGQPSGAFQTTYMCPKRLHEVSRNPETFPISNVIFLFRRLSYGDLSNVPARSSQKNGWASMHLEDAFFKTKINQQPCNTFVKQLEYHQQFNSIQRKIILSFEQTFRRVCEKGITHVQEWWK